MEILPTKSGKQVPAFDLSNDLAAQSRLKEVLERIGSLAKAGEIAGVSDEQIARWRDGKAKASFAGMAALTYAAGLSLDWLVTGVGESSYPRPPMVAAGETEIPGFTLVPRLDVGASAGNGMVPYGEETLDFLAFQESWLRARRINPSAARVVTARGDSMEETIRDGDVLLVDTSIDRFRDNAIYVVVYGDMVLVKRVHGRANGSLQLISDNPRYPSEEVSAGEVDLINIAGRVMWFGRSI